MEHSLTKLRRLESADELIGVGKREIYNWTIPIRKPTLKNWGTRNLIRRCLKNLRPHAEEIPVGGSVADDVVEGTADEDSVQ